jgi:chromosome condensin MukBEF MukE localization factor
VKVCKVLYHFQLVASEVLSEIDIIRGRIDKLLALLMPSNFVRGRGFETLSRVYAELKSLEEAVKAGTGKSSALWTQAQGVFTTVQSSLDSLEESLISSAQSQVVE